MEELYCIVMVDGMETSIWSKILLCNKWGVIRLIVIFCRLCERFLCPLEPINRNLDYRKSKQRSTSEKCDEKMFETVASTCLISWQILISWLLSLIILSWSTMLQENCKNAGSARTTWDDNYDQKAVDKLIRHVLHQRSKPHSAYLYEWKLQTLEDGSYWSVSVHILQPHVQHSHWKRDLPVRKRRYRLIFIGISILYTRGRNTHHNVYIKIQGWTSSPTP